MKRCVPFDSYFLCPSDKIVHIRKEGTPQIRGYRNEIFVVDFFNNMLEVFVNGRLATYDLKTLVTDSFSQKINPLLANGFLPPDLKRRVFLNAVRAIEIASQRQESRKVISVFHNLKNNTIKSICQEIKNLKKHLTTLLQYDTIMNIMIEAPEILTKLIEKLQISKETLAAKMGVSVLTIMRWQRKETNPSYAELKLLNQIYNGYKRNSEKAK